MKKLISIILTTIILGGSLTACSKATVETSEILNTSATSEATTAATTTSEETTETTHPESHYEFNPHVSSSIMTEIMGQTMLDTYNNFIEAVLAGETTFECPDEETYFWVMGQFAYLYFPVVAEYTQMADGISYENGVGKFTYKIPYEDFQVKLQEFEDLTTEILNETMDDDFSDFEKCLALYNYFVSHYTYDYYVADNLGDPEIDNMVSGYRLLTEGQGICQEISVAYSFLLLEAGVDATVVKGEREYDGMGHQWSLVTIDGNNYHIDPTYGLGTEGYLYYFMMTDDKRYQEDSYNPDDFIPSTVYAQVYAYPDFSATDNTYRGLWQSRVIQWNTDENTLLVEDFYGQRHMFSYGDA